MLRHFSDDGCPFGAPPLGAFHLYLRFGHVSSRANEEGRKSYTIGQRESSPPLRSESSRGAPSADAYESFSRGQLYPGQP